MEQEIYPHSSDAIFWVELEKIKPNPYQPRRDFNEDRLRDLADSIRQYGVLQPLVVTRQEIEKEDGGIWVEYELIAGERRLRASKIAGLSRVPVIIRVGDDGDKAKLELAIIENIQREDLNAVDRARAFNRLYEEFNFKHFEIAKKIGMSREYVSNTIRLLSLPEEMLNSLSRGEITEGHCRPLLMLGDRPEEQATFFKELIIKKINVREAEQLARRIAFDKVRKKKFMPDPELMEIEERLTEKLGTRVMIERRDYGGKVVIDFFSPNDLKNFLSLISEGNKEGNKEVALGEEPVGTVLEEGAVSRSADAEREESEEGLYSIKNFSI